MPWTTLAGFSRASIDEVIDAGVLARSELEASHVIDRSHGAGPMSVIFHEGRYYLHQTDPDGPPQVEVPAERLQTYQLSTECVLEALAEANGIEPAVRHCASGLWVVGQWRRQEDELLVLFAPLGLATDLVWAVEEARATAHFDKGTLLAAGHDTAETSATRLGEHGMSCYVLPDVLGDDLKLNLPTPARSLLEVDTNVHAAQWKGRTLSLGDADFHVLELLARRVGEDVTRPLLVRAGGVVRRPEAVRTSVMKIRKAIRAVDSSVDVKRSREILQTIRSVGYKLTLDPWEVRVRPLCEDA